MSTHHFLHHYRQSITAHYAFIARDLLITGLYYISTSPAVDIDGLRCCTWRLYYHAARHMQCYDIRDMSLSYYTYERAPLHY